jgi:HSP20 family protein
MTLIKTRQPALAAWPGFGRITTLQEELDRLFDSTLNELGGSDGACAACCPALEVHEDKDRFVIKTDLPGMTKENINVSLHEGDLVISGERKGETKTEDSKVVRSERYYGSFRRVLALPAGVEADKVKADYKDGVLTITLPKAEETKPRQINVSVN